MYFELYNKQLKLYTQTTLPEAICEYYIISIASSYGKLTSVLAFWPEKWDKNYWNIKEKIKFTTCQSIFVGFVFKIKINVYV